MYVCCVSVYVCVFLFFISMRERHFFVFFFFFLLLRYVKFSSHIRRKKSSNKVELTNTRGSTAFRSCFSFSFLSFFVSFSSTERKPRQGIYRMCLPAPLFLVSFFYLIAFSLAGRKKKKQSAWTTTSWRDDRTVTAYGNAVAQIASACTQYKYL